MRKRRLETDSEPVVAFDSLKSFTAASEIPTGRFSINYNNLPIDFAYNDTESTTLVICFHGAAGSEVSLPWHVGRGILDGINANWLAVSDPSLTLSSKLRLSWYAGSIQQPELQQQISDVIQHVTSAQGLEHLIFFGSSGGGFAALEMARRFPGALALPMNPQTAIQRHNKTAINCFVDYAWDGKTPLNNHTTVTYDLTEAYGAEFPCTVAYVQNTWDSVHISMHLLPMLRKVENHPNLWLLFDAWGDPAKDTHVPPPKSLIKKILTLLVNSEGNWAQALGKCGFNQDTVAGTIRDRAQTANQNSLLVSR